MVAAVRELAVPLGVESPACSSVPAAAGRGFCTPGEVGLGLPPRWGAMLGGCRGCGGAGTTRTAGHVFWGRNDPEQGLSRIQGNEGHHEAVGSSGV